MTEPKKEEPKEEEKPVFISHEIPRPPISGSYFCKPKKKNSCIRG